LALFCHDPGGRRPRDPLRPSSKRCCGAESLCPRWQSARLPERGQAPRVRTSPMLGFRGPNPHIPCLPLRLYRDSRQKRPKEWISSSHGRTA
jgi:hypothetical protein